MNTDEKATVSKGDLVTHTDHPDFQGRVVSVDNGKARVTVIRGWRGPTLPRRPVPIPTRKCVVV